MIHDFQGGTIFIVANSCINQDDFTSKPHDPGVNAHEDAPGVRGIGSRIDALWMFNQHVRIETGQKLCRRKIVQVQFVNFSNPHITNTKLGNGHCVALSYQNKREGEVSMTLWSEQSPYRGSIM